MRFLDYLNERASASRDTVLQESLHCVAFSIAQIKGGNISEQDLLNVELFDSAYKKFCKVDIGMNDIYQFAEAQKSWRISVVNACNVFINSRYCKYKNYMYYRGKGIMEEVYNQFRQLSAKEGIKLQGDKWNPGDIWASKITSLPEFHYVSELNEFIDKSLKNGSLMGISLKKTKGMPKIELVGKESSGPAYSYNGIKKGSPENTGIEIFIDKEGSVFNVRSFRISEDASIQAEILGVSARHGKKSPLNWINEYKIPQMNIQKIRKEVSEGNISFFIKYIVDLWKDIGYSYSYNIVEKGVMRQLEKYKGQETGYFRSIINSLEFGAFLNKNKGIADKIINEIVMAASSKSDISSTHLKIK